MELKHTKTGDYELPNLTLMIIKKEQLISMEC